MMRAWLCTIVGLALPGCSLILDFSDSAAPKDAAPPDAFYTAAECAYDEPDDTIDTAASVTTADMGPAAICPTGTGMDDLDFYRFDVPDTASVVTIELMYVARPDGDLDLALYDDTESTIATVGGNQTTKTITCPSATGVVCPMLAAGTYTFEVSPDVPGNVNDYTFSISID
jgi:hypothetical protein